MKRILIVEDDEILLKSLTFYLTMNQFEVLSHNNGADALEILDENIESINLIITDLNLPFAGGQQIIQTVRKEKKSDIPVIVLTASGIEATELEVLDLGADEFISKPFSPAILLKRIQKLIA
ncbi:Response regulator receiver domain-containing protein [Algoriphagus faecimaris]|uniref:Response regulator receiver domain-containing protein n=1 Tax=Algoriphagus faecimaris TaxID=686796 RepID=A0A1G6VKA0_9BACT|nr:response regulator transcription factor [Algoriphagus faecimaris]SDD54040.1 Response regulator receiver domain-containing protein [Algoriphagus faecimaris]